MTAVGQSSWELAQTLHPSFQCPTNYLCNISHSRLYCHSKYNEVQRTSQSMVYWMWR